MARASLPEERRREVEELAAASRAQGRPPPEIAAEIVALAGITPLWAWRLAKGWRRSELLERLRRLGDPSVDESMVWRWEIGERDPSKEHLDRLCRVYQTRPDLLGYGRDYSRPRQPTPPAAGSAMGCGAAGHGAAGREAAGPGAGACPRLHNPSRVAAVAVGGALEVEPLAMVHALTSSSVSVEMLEFLERSTERLQRAARTPTASGTVMVGEAATAYRAVRAALQRCQRVEERRRLARMAARLGGQLGLLLWDLDEPVALAYFDASAVAADEAGDPALGAWVAERRASRTGG